MIRRIDLRRLPRELIRQIIGHVSSRPGVSSGLLSKQTAASRSKDGDGAHDVCPVTFIPDAGTSADVVGISSAIHLALHFGQLTMVRLFGRSGSGSVSVERLRRSCHSRRVLTDMAQAPGPNS